MAICRFFCTMDVDQEIESILLKLLPDGLELFSVKTAVVKGGAVIKVALDKPNSKYGSPSIEELESVSRQLSDSLSALPEAFQNPQVEVTSPGAERALRLPGDLPRFLGFPMKVQFYEEDKIQVKRLRLQTVQDAVAVWTEFKKHKKQSKKNADVKQVEIPIKSLKAVNLILEY